VKCLALEKRLALERNAFIIEGFSGFSVGIRVVN
jgi:hypothetical protein